MVDTNDIKEAVRKRYAETATQGSSCCGPENGSGPGCGCGNASTTAVGGSTKGTELGYTLEDLAAIPEGADLGLGCGNPLAILDLREGETVLDLGSGGGIDCFIAAKRVGPSGRVIGVDMTPEMVARARRNAAAGGHGNVEFRLGEIEHLPVADASIDAIISNCVINLVPDKRQVFADAFRALRPGGRLSVSDIVLLGEIPLQIRDSVEAYVACLSGAALRDDYLAMLADAGFTDVRVTAERTFSVEDVGAADVVEEIKAHTGATEAQLRDAAGAFQSIRVAASKPV
jgi:arsenite methyltransferase